MTCKDCLHYEACVTFTKLKDSEFAQNFNEAETLCDIFKNKTDFVEVVRCGNCKHSNEDGTICRYSVGRAVEPEHFCSYGVRKNENSN